jgi:subtilisin family serine protease
MIYRRLLFLTLALVLSALPTDVLGENVQSRIVVKLAPEAQALGLSQYSGMIDGLLEEGAIAAESPLFSEKQSHGPILASSGSDFPFDRYRIVVLDETADGEAILEALSSLPEIDNAEFDYPIELYERPDDPELVNEWGLENVGQQYPGIWRRDGTYNDTLIIKQGTPGADIHVASTWTNTAPRARPLIVIIDTGLDIGHPDIVDNLWVNPGEIAGNGMDDDHNGYVDDTHGWDFSGNEVAIGQILVGDNDVSDDVGHGTHVTGTVGATSDNGIGIAGVCIDAKVAGLKIFPNAVMSVAAKAIVYSVNIGAEVINMSWGSPFRSTILLDALTYARSQGVLPVAAAGNFGNDMGTFPASFPVSMTVGASNSDDEVTFFSSFGDWLSVIAPGRDVLSLRAAGTDMYAENGEPEVRIINDNYYLADGSSMSAPHVCGVAAVLLSYSPGLTPDRLQEIIEQSADDIVHPYGDADSTFVGWDRYSGHGRVNVDAALAMLHGTLAKFSLPYSRQIITTDMDIIGYAYSESGDSYSIDISPTNDMTDWNNITSGSANVQGGSLGTLPISGRVGDYTLRLSVGDDNVAYRRVTMIAERLFEIDLPRPGDTVSWFLTVRGSALDPELESYGVFLKSNEDDAEWDTIFESSEAVADSLLCEVSLGIFQSGDYTLRITGYTPTEEIHRDVAITIEDKLIGTFPQPAPQGGVLHFAAAVCNIDGEGDPEVIVSSREGVVALESDGTPFCCGWPNLWGADCYSAVSAFDINLDGISEIAVISEYGLELFDCYGARIEGFPKIKPTGYMSNSYPTPLLADLDSDGEYEILWIAMNGHVYAYRSNGMPYFASLDGEFASTHASYYFGAMVPFLTCVDIEGDGEAEVIAGYSSSSHGGAVYVWQAENGQPKWGAEPMIAQVGKLRGNCMADFDQNGTYDIAVVGRTINDTVFAAIMNVHGDYLPGWPKVLRNRLQHLVTYPAAADIDGDGYPELVFSISSLDNGEIYIMRYDGTLYSPNLSGDGSYFAAIDGALGNVVIGDVSGDGLVDVVVRAGSVFPGVAFERIYAFDREGDIIDGWPIYTYASPTQVLSTFHTPALADIDSDGLLDLVSTSDDNHLYVWRLETPYDPDNIPWGQFLHDSRKSGVLPGRGAPTASDDEHEGVLPESFSLGQNYPNPFNPTTTIEFYTDRSAHVSLHIFNILGQRIRILMDAPMELGKHSVVWDGRDDSGNDAASGMYFYRIQAGSNVQTRKMVKLK